MFNLPNILSSNLLQQQRYLGLNQTTIAFCTEFVEVSQWSTLKILFNNAYFSVNFFESFFCYPSHFRFLFHPMHPTMEATMSLNFKITAKCITILYQTFTTLFNSYSYYVAPGPITYNLLAKLQFAVAPEKRSDCLVFFSDIFTFSCK